MARTPDSNFVTFIYWYIIIGLLLIGMALAGGLLKRLPLTTSMLYLAVAVLLGLVGSSAGRMEQGLVCWFGIRGIGSVYYLLYAITHGLAEKEARLLTGLTLSLIAACIVVHGLSVTPLMMRYRRIQQSASDRARPAQGQ